VELAEGSYSCDRPALDDGLTDVSRLFADGCEVASEC
jgi:hypothetical protein